MIEYLWIKAAHIVFVVAWMASLLIYPRYKIHQLGGEPDGELAETMKEAAGRLRRIIMTPSMVIVWGLGLIMIILQPNLSSQGWLHVKLALLLVLTGLHGWFVYLGRRIDDHTPTVSSRTLRMINEVPFVLMIVIVGLAVIKPF